MNYRNKPMSTLEAALIILAVAELCVILAQALCRMGTA